MTYRIRRAAVAVHDVNAALATLDAIWDHFQRENVAMLGNGIAGKFGELAGTLKCLRAHLETNLDSLEAAETEPGPRLTVIEVTDRLDWSQPYSEPDPYAIERAGDAA